MNKRRTGALYEQKAAEYLQKNGYQILQNNYRCRQGEIDLIARDGEYLVFVEVKYRSSRHCGTGADAVDFRKQQRIIAAARYYLREHHMPETVSCRFDVVAVDGDEVTLIQDAFWT